MLLLYHQSHISPLYFFPPDEYEHYGNVDDPDNNINIPPVPRQAGADVPINENGDGTGANAGDTDFPNAAPNADGTGVRNPHDADAYDTGVLNDVITIEDDSDLQHYGWTKRNKNNGIEMPSEPRELEFLKSLQNYIEKVNRDMRRFNDMADLRETLKTFQTDINGMIMVQFSRFFLKKHSHLPYPSLGCQCSWGGCRYLCKLAFAFHSE